MGILDDYLAQPTSTDNAPAAVVSKPSGILDQYMANTKGEEKPKIRVIIGPNPVPISGVSKEESDRFNAENANNPSPTGPSAPEPFPLSPTVVIPNIARAIKNNAVQGASDVGSGLTSSNFGQAGLGALRAVTSIPAGIGEGVGTGVTSVTGNPDFGGKVGDVVSMATPIIPGSNLIKLPTSASGAISSAISNAPSKSALRDLVSDITGDGANPGAIGPLVREMKANPRIGPADLSPSVLSAAQKVFTQEGNEAKNYLADTSSARVASSKNAVNSAFDTAAGIPVNAVQKLKDLSDAAKKVGDKEIEPAVKNSGSVNITPVVEHIDNILKPGVMQKITGESTLPFNETKQALSNVKGMIANKKEQLTDPQALHEFQKALRVQAEARMSSADGAQRQLGHALMNVRNKVVDAINEASPKNAEGKGTYKPALSNYRDEKHISEAFHDAYNGVLTNSKKLENRPEFTEDWFKGLSEHEKEAAREGLRTRIDSEIGVARNPALAGTSLGKSDFNKSKMTTMLGKEETDNLLQKLEHERSISNTHNKIVEGSQTAMRLASDSRRTLPAASEVGKTILPAAVLEGASMMTSGTPGLGTAAYFGSKIGLAAKDAIKMKLAKEANLAYAKLALPTQGPSRDALIKELENHITAPKQSILRRGASALSRVVAP